MPSFSRRGQSTSRLTASLVVGLVSIFNGCSHQAEDEPTQQRSTGPSVEFQIDASEQNAVDRQATDTDTALRESVSRLLTLMNRRMALMPDVARFKFANQLPVSVPEREAELLRALVEQADTRGVKRQLAESVFFAQFAAARQLQSSLISEWTAAGQPPFENVPDLTTQIRPQITELSEAILDELVVLQHFDSDQLGEMATELAVRLVTAPGVTDSIRGMMLRSLTESAMSEPPASDSAKPAC